MSSNSGAHGNVSAGGATKDKAHKSQVVRNDNPASLVPAIRTVATTAPIDWLKRGWGDLLGTRFQGVFYGLIFVLMGYAIVWMYATKWQLTMGLVGGFFLVGPFLCSGIYDLSRQREMTGKASLLPSLTCWRRSPGSIAFFAFILTFAMIVWARVSLVLFALSSNISFPTLQDALQKIFSLANPQFLFIWSGAGFVFAAIVFSIGAISAPMILDRQSDTMVAVFSSVRSVFNNPKPMFIWAALVVLIIGLSLAFGFLLLLVTAPLVGHATWHAYRDLVEKPPQSATL